MPEATRVEILDTAIEVLAEKGPMGLTMDAVVERVPFSKGALLHHFPNKTALLEGMIDRLGESFVAQIEAYAAKDPEPYGRGARAYLRAVIDEPVTDRDVSIGRAGLAVCAIDPALAGRWKAWMRKAQNGDPSDPAGSDDALLMRLLADGLWMSDLFGTYEISPDQRKALASLMMAGTVMPEAMEQKQ
ncbi:TetR/AcrR family transcriptional regulator [Brevundimonas sp.]|uniref:TetR/AcrR family transcriptional regulator n=1 Tax=Brevundimonas sp. TaxID=1871086 RepID=UPI002FC83C1B